MTTPSAYGTYAAKSATTGAVATQATSTLGSTTQNDTYQYKPAQAASKYTDYLAKDYNSALPTNEQGQTAYDLQRGQIKSDAEAARQSRQESLQRQLSAMGVQDSGIALKQNRMLQADIERESGRQMSNVDKESLLAQERRNERLGSQAFQYDSNMDMITQRTLAELTTMDYQDVLRARGEDRKVQADYYHALGESGGLDEAALSSLQKNNPTAYLAYKAGEAGKSVNDARREIEMQDKYVNALISSFDTDSPAFHAALADLFTKLGVDMPDGIGTGEAGGTGASLYQTASKPANEVSYTSLVGGDKPEAANHTQYKAVFEQAPEFTGETYKNTDGMNSMDFADIPPKQSYFKNNGKLYYRGTSDPQEVGKWGINSQKFKVYDVQAGKWINIDTKDY